MEKKKENSALEQFLSEQKEAQRQVDKNNSVMEELLEEWKKYPDGKPEIKCIGNGHGLYKRK